MAIVKAAWRWWPCVDIPRGQDSLWFLEGRIPYDFLIKLYSRGTNSVKAGLMWFYIHPAFHKIIGNPGNISGKSYPNGILKLKNNKIPYVFMILFSSDLEWTAPYAYCCIVVLLPSLLLLRRYQIPGTYLVRYLVPDTWYLVRTRVTLSSPVNSSLFPLHGFFIKEKILPNGPHSGIPGLDRPSFH
jgi:hypothetical protein